MKDLTCNRCTGRGYVGRWERGKWKLRNCRRCNGSGQCEPEQRNPAFRFKAPA